MTIAFWCILIAGLMPYVWVGFAKSSKQMNNAQPRVYLERQKGFRQRANWAHMNAFEAFPFFAAAVLVAHLAGGEPGTIDLLAMIFVAARVVYGIFYIIDQHILRSLAWFVGIGCVIGLFVVAA